MENNFPFLICICSVPSWPWSYGSWVDNYLCNQWASTNPTQEKDMLPKSKQFQDIDFTSRFALIADRIEVSLIEFFLCSFSSIPVKNTSLYTLDLDQRHSFFLFYFWKFCILFYAIPLFFNVCQIAISLFVIYFAVLLYVQFYCAICVSC